MFSVYELTRRTVGMLSVAALALLVSPVNAAGEWQTTLQGRDLDGDTSTFEALYDANLNITWLADANYALTSGYSSAANGGLAPYSIRDTNAKFTDGTMGWNAAKTWADNLVIGAYSDWRLPTVFDDETPGCSGNDCYNDTKPNGSELAHLFRVTLGNTGCYAYTPGQCDYANLGHSNTWGFQNLAKNFYWTNVGFANPAFGNRQEAFVFNFYSGVQQQLTVDSSAYALVVHPGDIGLAAVPEPSAYALMGLGLAAVLFVYKKKPQ